MLDNVFESITQNKCYFGFYWYFNGVEINGVTGNTFTALEFGDYRVVVIETQGCTGMREFMFSIMEAAEPFPDVGNIPNVISPNGDGINDTWVIPTAYVQGTQTKIKIFNNQGKQVFETSDYQNNWPQEAIIQNSINQVFYYIISPNSGDEKKGSITIIN